MTATWLISSLIVLTAAVVLAVVLWPHQNGPATGGRAELERAKRQQEKVQPLIRDLRVRRERNNFAPLIKNALRPGGH